MTRPLADRVAVVTGASRGLGQVVAHVLLERGAHLVLAARDRETLDSVAIELESRARSTTQQIVSVAADVARPADVERLVRRTEHHFGRLDILVCNAGVYGPLGSIEDVDWTEWVKAIEINLFGTILMCRRRHKPFAEYLRVRCLEGCSRAVYRDTGGGGSRHRYRRQLGRAWSAEHSTSR